jgi:hypothetical protein
VEHHHVYAGQLPLPHAWRRRGDIKDFIAEVTPKEGGVLFRDVEVLDHGGQLAEGGGYLSTCSDSEFMELCPNRLWRALCNGLYHAETQTFHKWGDAAIPLEVVACNYHQQQEWDERMLETPYWFDIPTPEISLSWTTSLASLAGSPPPVTRTATRSRCGCVYAFMGRLLCGRWARATSGSVASAVSMPDALRFFGVT